MRLKLKKRLLKRDELPRKLAFTGEFSCRREGKGEACDAVLAGDGDDFFVGVQNGADDIETQTHALPVHAPGAVGLVSPPAYALRRRKPFGAGKGFPACLPLYHTGQGVASLGYAALALVCSMGDARRGKAGQKGSGDYDFSEHQQAKTEVHLQAGGLPVCPVRLYKVPPDPPSHTSERRRVRPRAQSHMPVCRLPRLGTRDKFKRLHARPHTRRDHTRVYGILGRHVRP